MTKAKSRKLLNQSKKDITLVEIVETNLVLSITVGEDAFILNQTWDEDKLQYEQQATDDDLYFKVDLTRDNTDKENPKFYGQIDVSANVYQIITSTGVTYKLYKSQVQVVNGEKQPDDLGYVYWKSLEVSIQWNTDHTLGTSYSLDGKEANAILYNDSLTCSYNETTDDLSYFSLAFSLLSDSLTGYWLKNTDKDDKLQTQYYFKADISGNFKPVEDFTSPDSSLTLSELVSLSIYTTENNEVVDNACKYSAEGFDTLIRYCMDDTYRKNLLGEQKPQLSVDLQDILKKKHKDFRDPTDFYKEYSLYWLAKALSSNSDDSLKNIDYTRVDGYLNSGVLQDYNYVVQTNCLYKYGYKKAMPRIVDYIQDAVNKNKTYWAEQLFMYFSQDQKLSEMALLLISSNEDDVSKAKDTISTIMYKMNILDDSMKYSKELFNKVQNAMYQEANLEFMKKLSEDEEDIVNNAEEYQDEVNTFIDMINETAKKMTDTLTQEFLYEVAREATSNLRLGLELYMIGNRINLHETLQAETAVEEITKKSSSLGSYIKDKMFGSKTKFAMFALGMICNMASMFFMTMNYSSLSTSEKAELIASWTFLGAANLSMFIGKSVSMYKDWKQNKQNKAITENMTVEEKTAWATEMKLKGAERLKDEGFLKNTKKSLKTMDGMCRVIGIIGSAMNLAFTIKSLVDACEADDAFNIGLDAGMIVAQSVETVTMCLAIGLKNGAALANAIIGDFAAFVSLVLMIISAFQKQESAISVFVNSSSMSHLRFHDMYELETYQEFTQRVDDSSKSSTSRLVNGNNQLSLNPTKLSVLNTSTKKETIIASFENPNNSTVKMTIDLSQIKCQIVDSSTLLATLNFGEEMNFIDLPMYLKLADDGTVLVRTTSGKQFPVNSDTFKPVKQAS